MIDPGQVTWAQEVLFLLQVEQWARPVFKINVRKKNWHIRERLVEQRPRHSAMLKRENLGELLNHLF